VNKSQRDRRPFAGGQGKAWQIVGRATAWVASGLAVGALIAFTVADLVLGRLGANLSGEISLPALAKLLLSAALAGPTTWSLPGLGVKVPFNGADLVQGVPLSAIGLLAPAGATLVAVLGAWASAGRPARHRTKVNIGVTFACWSTFVFMGAGSHDLRAAEVGTSLSGVALGASAAIAIAWLALYVVHLASVLLRRLALRRAAVLASAFSLLLVATVPSHAGALEPAPEPAPTAELEVADEYAAAGVDAAYADLQQESGNISERALDPFDGTANFITTSSALGQNPRAWLIAHSALFAIPQMDESLAVGVRRVDDRGSARVSFDQQYQGLPVDGGRVVVHLNVTETRVVAVSNSLFPDVQLPTTAPTRTAADATAAARVALPGGRSVEEPRLVVLPGQGTGPTGRADILAWRVWLANEDTSVSNLYYVQARGYGIAHVVTRRQPLDRRVFDSNNTSRIFRTSDLVRSEGGAPSDIAEADRLYWNTGRVSNFYSTNFGQGINHDDGRIFREKGNSRVYYGGQINAFWNGEGTGYTDGMTGLDIVGHEWTHAVTETSAGVAYSDASGAINESYSDIMGEMVELFATGSTDWLVGTDAPSGPLRSMKNPAAYGQPGDLRDYKITCSDNGGVHANSGISNRAFYLLSTRIGTDKAMRIFYYALTHFLPQRPNFTTLRVATAKAADELYPPASNSPRAAVISSWNDVGVDGHRKSPTADCGCTINLSLTGSGLAALDPAGPSANTIKATLYRLRDSRMPNTIVGRYYQEVWSQTTGRMAKLAVQYPDVREAVSRFVQDAQPGLQALVSGQGGQSRVTQAQVNQLNTVLDTYIARAPDSILAQTLRRERTKVHLQVLVGMTYSQAEAELERQIVIATASRTVQTNRRGVETLDTDTCGDGTCSDDGIESLLPPSYYE